MLRFKKLAEGPGVARGKIKFEKKNFLAVFAYNTPGHPWVSAKNVSPIGPAVCPAIRNIYMNVLFYYIDSFK